MSAARDGVLRPSEPEIEGTLNDLFYPATDKMDVLADNASAPLHSLK